MTVVWGFVYEVQAKEFGYQRCDLKDSVIIITTIGLNLVLSIPTCLSPTG